MARQVLHHQRALAGGGLPQALALARGPLNSDYAGHRLTFQLFARSSAFAHLAAVYRNFDWDEPLDFVRRSAGLSDRVAGGKPASHRAAERVAGRWWESVGCVDVAQLDGGRSGGIVRPASRAQRTVPSRGRASHQPSPRRQGSRQVRRSGRPRRSPLRPKVSQAERDRVERPDAHRLVVLRARDRHPLPIPKLKRLERSVRRIDQPKLPDALTGVDRALVLEIEPSRRCR